MGFHIHIHNLKGNMMMKPMGFLNRAFFFFGIWQWWFLFKLEEDGSEVLMSMAHKQLDTIIYYRSSLFCEPNLPVFFADISTTSWARMLEVACSIPNFHHRFLSIFVIIGLIPIFMVFTSAILGLMAFTGKHHQSSTFVASFVSQPSK